MDNAARLVEATALLVEAKGVKDIQWDEVKPEVQDLASDAASLQKACEAKDEKKTQAALYLVIRSLAAVLEQFGGQKAAREIADAGKTFLQS